MSNIAYLDILKYHNVSQMCDYHWDVLKARKHGWFLNASLIHEMLVNSDCNIGDQTEMTLFLSFDQR